MKITVLGCGYVGLTTGACLADLGHEVICFDTNEVKISKLKKGMIPIYEPNLNSIIANNTLIGRLSFTHLCQQALAKATFVMIAVGTPPSLQGETNLIYIQNAAEMIACHIQQETIICMKSTVPVGTTEWIAQKIREKSPHPIHMLFNPEFLKEGLAVHDFMHPERIVLGFEEKKALSQGLKLYEPLNLSENKIISMSIKSAEMTKYAANAMLATRISFMNEMSQIAEKVGANIEDVKIGIGSDQRIGKKFLNPGCGYGGSCFPKDLQSLIFEAKKLCFQPKLLEATVAVNKEQPKFFIKKILTHFKQNITNKTIAIWGLSFKPDTDDIREAPSLVIIDALLQHGACIQAHDPKAINNFREHFDAKEAFSNLTFHNDMFDTLENAHALVICTEWPVFCSANIHTIKDKLKEPTIFDGRNIFAKINLSQYELNYYGIGY